MLPGCFCRQVACKNNWHIKCLLVMLVVAWGAKSVYASPTKLEGKYNMYVLGANIGSFSVVQTEENGDVEVKAVTDVKVNLLLSYRIKYVQHTVYNQGVLQHSRIETYKNGKLNSDMWIKRKEGAYLLIAGMDTSVINDPITYSGSLVYFNEPVGVKKIFKERTAEVSQLNVVGKHTYCTKDEKGREINRYYYKDGVLLNAKMKHALGIIEFKLDNTGD